MSNIIQVTPFMLVPDLERKLPKRAGELAAGLLEAGPVPLEKSEDAVDAVAVHGFPLDWNLWMIQDWPEKLAAIRQRVAFLEQDRYMAPDIEAMRLWALDRTTCQQALDDLVREGFLQRDDTGRYARANGGY